MKKKKLCQGAIFKNNFLCARKLIVNLIAAVAEATYQLDVKKKKGDLQFDCHSKFSSAFVKQCKHQQRVFLP